MKLEIRSSTTTEFILQMKIIKLVHTNWILLAWPNQKTTQKWSAVPSSPSDSQLMVDYYLTAKLVCLHAHTWKQLSKEQTPKESVSDLIRASSPIY